MPDDYIHRVGRTARAEAIGDAFTLVAPEDHADLGRIERAVGSRIPRVHLEGFAYEATADAPLLGEFGVAVFDDDVPAPKPDPTGLRQAAKALGVPPERVLYVGDSGSDMEAARRAGARGLAVLWAKKADEVEGFRERAWGLGAGAVEAPGEVIRLVLSE